LSLLGTWEGDESEKWNKNESNLFQILISIQSLILVSEPYFNEPGYMEYYKTPEGTKSSIKYNNKIRMYTINHGINDLLQDLISNTPNYLEFHDIIRNHFKYKKDEILIKINEWETLIDENDYGMGEYTLHDILKKSYIESIEKYKKLIKFL